MFKFMFVLSSSILAFVLLLSTTLGQGGGMARADGAPPPSPTPSPSSSPGGPGTHHYAIDTLAWIPQEFIVDPVLPQDHVHLEAAQYGAVLGDGPCVLPRPFDLIFGVQNYLEKSRYHGDGHSQYGPSYRAYVTIGFDWDGSKITNLTTNHVDGTTFRYQTWTIDGKTVFCTAAGHASPADSTGSVTAPNQFEVHIGPVAGTNPLIPPILHPPHINSAITGSVDPDGTVHLHNQTSGFPSVGFQVYIDNSLAETYITNDVNCLSASDVLGWGGLSKVAQGLGSLTNSADDTVVVTDRGIAAGDQLSPLCSSTSSGRTAAPMRLAAASSETVATPAFLPAPFSPQTDVDDGKKGCKDQCGVITGTAHSASDAAKGVKDICVIATTAGGSPVATTITHGDGQYRLPLFSGDYLVRFEECAGGSHVTQWFKDADVQDRAQIIHVGADTTIDGIDANLSEGSVVTGRVISGDGRSLKGICVHAAAADNQTGHFADSNATDDDGKYSVGGLPQGTYHLTFSDCSGGDYLTQALGAPVTVSGSGTTAGPNTTMIKGGEITGRVTDADGKPLDDRCVSLLSNQTSESTAMTEPSGKYVIHAIPDGSYTVAFLDCKDGVFIPQAWRNQSVFAPTSTEVRNGEITGGIDAAMVFGGSITGIVHNVGNAPIAGICASAVDEQGRIVGTTFSPSDSSGHYQIGGLSTGQYSIEFRDCSQGNHLTARGLSASVTTGATTSVADVTLPDGGTITGTVVDANGNPVQNVCVLADDSADSTDSVGTAATTVNGTYSITGLASGDYTVSFQDCYGSAHQAVTYPTKVHVDTDIVTSGIDAKLQ